MQSMAAAGASPKATGGKSKRPRFCDVLARSLKPQADLRAWFDEQLGYQPVQQTRIPLNMPNVCAHLLCLQYSHYLGFTICPACAHPCIASVLPCRGSSALEWSVKRLPTHDAQCPVFCVAIMIQHMSMCQMT